METVATRRRRLEPGAGGRGLEVNTPHVFSLTLALCPGLVGAQDATPKADAKTKQPRIKAGLRWLADRQGADGAWGNKDKLALTGMSGLALLASGSTPQKYFAREPNSACSSSARRALLIVDSILPR